MCGVFLRCVGCVCGCVWSVSLSVCVWYVCGECVWFVCEVRCVCECVWVVVCVCVCECACVCVRV